MFEKRIELGGNFKLNVFYRVCDKVECTSVAKRHFGQTKKGLIAKCLERIKENVLNLDDRIKLSAYVVSNNCSPETVERVKETFSTVDSEIKIMPELNNPATFLECVRKCCEIADGNEMVYFLEDDYTFLRDDVLNRLVFSLDFLRKKNSAYVGIMPDDYPDRYENGTAKNKNVVVGESGHFLEVDKSTLTFATFAGAVRENAELLYNHRFWPRVNEDQSVNLMWKKVRLYQPLPAWTVHTQYDFLVPKYLDTEEMKKHFEEKQQ